MTLHTSTAKSFNRWRNWQIHCRNSLRARLLRLDLKSYKNSYQPKQKCIWTIRHPLYPDQRRLVIKSKSYLLLVHVFCWSNANKFLYSSPEPNIWASFINEALSDNCLSRPFVVSISFEKPISKQFNHMARIAKYCFINDK